MFKTIDIFAAAVLMAIINWLLYAWQYASQTPLTWEQSGEYAATKAGVITFAFIMLPMLVGTYISGRITLHRDRQHALTQMVRDTMPTPKQYAAWTMSALKADARRR